MAFTAYTPTLGSALYINSSGKIVDQNNNAAPEVVVTVSQFGAVGNGVADDTAAIQRALSASTSVCLQAGTYRVTSPISISNSGTALWGLPGAVVACCLPGGTSSSWPQVFTVSGSDCVVRNVTFTNPLAYEYQIACRVTGARFALQQNRFYNLFCGILAGTFGSPQEGHSITNNQFVDMYGKYDSEASPDTITVFDYRSVISNNCLRLAAGRTQRAGIVWDNSSQAACDSVVENNIVYGNYTRSIHVENAVGGVVASNRVSGGQSWGLRIENSTNVTVNNNSVSSSSSNALGTSGAQILLHLCVNCSATGNSLTTTAADSRAGINVFGCDQVSISANTIYSTSASFGWAWALININTGTLSHVIVSNNILSCNSVAPEYGVSDVRTGGGGLVCTGNVFSGAFGTAAIVSSPNAAFSGNVVRGFTVYGAAVRGANSTVSGNVILPAAANGFTKIWIDGGGSAAVGNSIADTGGNLVTTGNASSFLGNVSTGTSGTIACAGNAATVSNNSLTAEALGLASGATVTFTRTGPWQITGTTAITTFASLGVAEGDVTLEFTSAGLILTKLTLAAATPSTILSADFTSTVGATLSLRWFGSFWAETARSLP